MGKGFLSELNSVRASQNKSKADIESYRCCVVFKNQFYQVSKESSLFFHIIQALDFKSLLPNSEFQS